MQTCAGGGGTSVASAGLRGEAGDTDDGEAEGPACTIRRPNMLVALVADTVVCGSSSALSAGSSSWLLKGP